MKAIAAAVLALTACTQISGGAVELNWALRPASSSDPDKFVDCTLNAATGTNPITAIRLVWISEDDTMSSTFWQCTDNHGVTGFSLAPGNTLLSVLPECGDHVPADPLTYTAPAPVLRTVSAGNTVSLGAVQLVLQISNCDQQPCICH